MDKETWNRLSFEQQMGNLGSEIARASTWNDQKDTELKRSCLGRALHLLSLTINAQKSFPARLKELTYLQEILGDEYAGTHIYQTALTALNEYCTQFYLAQQLRKIPSL